ncbi:MAG: alpha/beta hydrolase [Sphingomicrobium sp.]
MRPFALILAACAASTLDWTGAAHAAPATVAAAAQRLGHITIRSVGTGAPVVLIPGLGSPPAVYDALAARIGPGHQLVFVQINGFAGSVAPQQADDTLLPSAVDELASWLAANHVERPAVIGHSMGGLMALMLASKHPAAAGKLMIVDALPFYGMLFGPSATPDAIRPVVEQMRAGLVSGKTPIEVPPHMTNSAAGKARILGWMRASDPKIVGEALVEDATTDVRSDLGRIAQPLTVLYAVSRPDRAPLAKALYADAYQGAPQVRLVPVDDSEHFIMLDQPEAFATAVAAFLK